MATGTKSEYITIRVHPKVKRSIEQQARREDRTVANVALRYLLKGMEAK